MRAFGYVAPIAFLIKIFTNSIDELSLAFYGLALFTGVVFLFTEWTLEINVDEKTFRQNLRFLIFKVGSKYSYNRIEKIFINKTHRQYQAFIKLENGEKSILDCDSDKDHLIKRLLEYNQLLKTNILDNSATLAPHWIAQSQN